MGYKIHRHKESDMQIRCVKWFRIQYPAFARLLEHPKNEGNGDRVRGAIAKAEGVQAGVADLILHLPSVSHYYNGELQEEPFTYHALAVELKTKTGRQSQDQKIFQRYFEAAGGKYLVVRDFDDFTAKVNIYMCGVPYAVSEAVKSVYSEIEKEEADAAKAELQRIINKA